MEKNKIKIGIGVLAVLICGTYYLCADSRTENAPVITKPFEDTAKPAATAAAKESEKSGKIYIDICGEVKNPGVYVFDTEPRIVEVVERAGGFTKNADKTALNQAQTVADGTQLAVVSKKNGKNPDKEKNQSRGKNSDKSSQSEGKININQATKEELMALNGIGESRAMEIISYRETNGSFSKIEDIMNIPGIKEGIFSRVKDRITV